MSLSYCQSRFQSLRRPSREVRIGSSAVGGNNPIRVQSMTTTPTQDVEATLKQAIALAEVGCEIIRITAPNVAAAKALKDIHRAFRAAGFDQPIVADIHFLPSAAMEAIEHVEKVRVNPGNYADKKKFAVIEYTDRDYEREIQRLYEAFSPLVKRAKTLGRALRIGTNHGSLSDRIMNRYGDSAMGMVESALEFIRIAESHGFKDIVLSMKSSNPKVMIQAYRLVVQKMLEENMHYPLHLGVTEAGEGEDARIKSAIGIGSLLYDGLGDTIRVSLTEDPVHEIPVCRDLAQRAMHLWSQAPLEAHEQTPDPVNPYEYERRESVTLSLGTDCAFGGMEPPRVIIPSPHALTEPDAIVKSVLDAHNQLKEIRIEGLLLKWTQPSEWPHVERIWKILGKTLKTLVLEVDPAIQPDELGRLPRPGGASIMLVLRFKAEEQDALQAWLNAAREGRYLLAVDAPASALHALAPVLSKATADDALVFTFSGPRRTNHALGVYRGISRELDAVGLKAPIWIRNTDDHAVQPDDRYFTARLLEASMLSGALLCDGIGDLVSIETEPDTARATTLAYNLLQGARTRTSKTEYVACPSCGRTLFDLQTTTQAIKAKTGHLKGVTIAVMGCIVNGPGEMADADFGYVGGAPEKINLYVGKQCVKYNIPETEAVDRLIDLIREHGKWVDP